MILSRNTGKAAKDIVMPSGAEWTSAGAGFSGRPTSISQKQRPGNAGTSGKSARAEREIAEQQAELSEQGISLSGDIRDILEDTGRNEKSLLLKMINTQIRTGNQIVNAIKKLDGKKAGGSWWKKKDKSDKSHNKDGKKDRKKKGEKDKDSDSDEKNRDHKKKHDKTGDGKDRPADSGKTDIDTSGKKTAKDDKDKPDKKGKDVRQEDTGKSPHDSTKSPEPEKPDKAEKQHKDILPDDDSEQDDDPDKQGKKKKSKFGKIKGKLGAGLEFASGIWENELFQSLVGENVTDAISEKVSGVTEAIIEKVTGGNESAKEKIAEATDTAAIGAEVATTAGSLLSFGGLSSFLTGGLGASAMGATSVGGLGAMGAGAMAGAAGGVGAAAAGGYGVGMVADKLISAMLIRSGLGENLGDAVYEGIHDEFGNLKIGKVIPVAEIKKGMDKTAGFLTDTVSAAYNASGAFISRGLTQAGDVLTSTLTGAFTAVSGIVSTGIEDTGKFLTGSLESLKTGVLTMVASAGTWMSDTIGGTFQKAKDFLSDTLGNPVESVKKTVGDIVDPLKELVLSGLPDAVKNLNPLKGLSSLVKSFQSGEMTPEDVLKGIAASATGIKDTATAFGEETGKKMLELFTPLLEAAGIKVEDQKPAAPSAPGNGGDTVKDMRGHTLGKLSEQYESGGKGPGVVSTGKGDQGGVSYGTYQFASNTGSADAYVKNSKYASEFKGMKAGSAEFSAKWKDIAARDPEGFRADQHEAIKKSHYDPFVKGVQGKTGLDINQRSKALQDVAWSIAVQHGAGRSDMFQNALKGKDPASLSDEQIINLVYDERGKRDAQGNVAYLKSNPKSTQENIANGRYVQERKNALAMLAGEQQGKNVTEAGGTPVKLDTNLRVKGGMNGQAFAGGKTHEGSVALAQAIQGMLGSDLNRFTAFNDEYHKGKNSKHAIGTALDFTISNASQSAAVSEKIRQMGAKMGVGLYVKDEYKYPSSRSTGGHIHVNFTSPEDANKFMAAVKGGGGLPGMPQDTGKPVQMPEKPEGGGGRSGGAGASGEFPVKTVDAVPAVKPVASVKTAEIPQKQMPEVEVLTPDQASPVTGKGGSPAGSPGGGSAPAGPQGTGTQSGTDADIAKVLAKIEMNTRNAKRKNDPSTERDGNIPTRTGDDYTDGILYDDV